MCPMGINPCFLWFGTRLAGHIGALLLVLVVCAAIVVVIVVLLLPLGRPARAIILLVLLRLLVLLLVLWWRSRCICRRISIRITVRVPVSVWRVGIAIIRAGIIAQAKTEAESYKRAGITITTITTVAMIATVAAPETAAKSSMPLCLA